MKIEIQEDPYLSANGDKVSFTTLGAAMNGAQVRFTCCGILGPADYVGSNYTTSVSSRALTVSPYIYNYNNYCTRAYMLERLPGSKRFFSYSSW